MDELAKLGYTMASTREDDITPLTVPMNLDTSPMYGKLKVRIEADEDLSILQNIVDGQAYARHATPYRIKVVAYLPETDALIEYEHYYGLDMIVAVLQLWREEDVIIKWKRR